MAAAFRASALAGDGSSSGSSTLTFTIPATAQVGDVALIEATTGVNSVTLTTPSGWTKLSGPDLSASVTNTHLLVRTLQAGDPGAGVTLTFSGSSRCDGVMAVYSGVTQTGLLWASQIDSTATTTPALPSLASVPAGAMVVALQGRRVGNETPATITPASGYTAAGTAQTNFTTGAVELTSTASHLVAASAGTQGGVNTASSPTSIGTSYLVALPSLIVSATGTMSGTGTLTASPTLATASQPGALSGSGTLSATQVPAVARSAALGGSGSLSALTVPAVARAAALSGSGSLSAVTAPGVSRAAVLGGDGTLTAATFGTVVAGLSGSGTLAAASVPGVVAAAALSGAGTLSATVRAAVARLAALSGSGSLTATGQAAVTRTAVLSGVGTLAARAIYRLTWWTGTTWMPLTSKVWTGTSWDDVRVTVTED